jgi:serine phosphatase RsbU (regulator of sigma subunit)
MMIGGKIYMLFRLLASINLRVSDFVAHAGATVGDVFNHHFSCTNEYGKRREFMCLTIFILFILMIFLPTVSLFAQANGSFFLSSDSLERYERIFIAQNWKYHPNDSATWASPQFDDSSWEITDTRLSAANLPQSGWNGIGWFRIQVKVDSALRRQPLMMRIIQAGASRILLDGKLIYDFGDDGVNPKRQDIYRDYVAFSFDDRPDHLIAVRYANYSTSAFQRAGRDAGFYLLIGHADALIDEGIRDLRMDSSIQMSFSALALAFGILHLVLFLFSPHSRSHLYFTIFVFLYAGNIFFDYQVFLSNDLRTELFYLRLHRAFMPCGLIFILLFLYSLFAERISKQFWLIAFGLIVTGFFAVLKPIDNLNYVFIFIYGAVIEIFRLMLLAIRTKKDGAAIIATGFIILAIFSSYDALLDLNLMRPVYEIVNGYTFGFLGLIVCMSVYLARDFAKTNEKMLAHERQVKEQEVQRRVLEADNARKTKELEEARALQVSMLPRAVPEHPTIDIGVFMGTATEVGGDYYDFHHAEDGTLTTVIGDATGHGMKAGIMVAVMKSLFSAVSVWSDVLLFFDQCTRILKKMNLGNLYMAATFVVIKSRKMKIASAGMPPVLIYRAATNTVDEVIMKTMPLGAHLGFPYRVEETTLARGDTLLLMTDGFAELFNDKEEILDYPAVVTLFKEVAEKSPAEIIGHLYIAGEKWRNGQAQRDDITFVVLKVAE